MEEALLEVHPLFSPSNLLHLMAGSRRFKRNRLGFVCVAAGASGARFGAVSNLNHRRLRVDIAGRVSLRNSSAR